MIPGNFGTGKHFSGRTEITEKRKIEAYFTKAISSQEKVLSRIEQELLLFLSNETGFRNVIIETSKQGGL
jgi:hypothetical protein